MLRGSPRWTKGLSFRLDVLLVLIVLAAIGAFAIYAIREQEDHILAETRRGSALLMETIRRSIDHHMMSDDRRTAYEVMTLISRQPGVTQVRLLDHRAKVTFSSDPQQVGRRDNLHAGPCANCHVSEKPLDPCPASLQEVVQGPTGARELMVVAPIYNEPRCSSGGCHAHHPSERVLGLMSLNLSLDEVDRGTAGLNRHIAVLSGLVLIGLVGGVAVFFRLLVLRPVRALVRGTQRVAQGDLDYAIQVQGEDELSQLAGSFNQMTESLRQTRGHLQYLMTDLERQVQQRTEALERAQAELIQSAKLSELGKLSASIAHEINNPLMGILTTAKLLLRSLDEVTLTEPQRRSFVRQLGLVQRESERCRNIVRNLLDFARQRSLELRVVNVNDAIEEVLSICSNQMNLQGVTLDKQLWPDLQARADFGHLRQAVLNIILNAIEAMPKGGKLTVRTAAEDEGRSVVIEIRDTGVGIPKEHLSNVWDPFFTTKDKGTGLGLSVVYGIIKRHRGTLEIDSTVGKGTQIRIHLPVAGPREGTEAQETP